MVTTAMLYLGLDTVVFLAASVYLSYVLPGDYGVRKSPFFPIIGVGVCMCVCGCGCTCVCVCVCVYMCGCTCVGVGVCVNVKCSVLEEQQQLTIVFAMQYHL